jgi:hypothetical protein
MGTENGRSNRLYSGQKGERPRPQVVAFLGRNGLCPPVRRIRLRAAPVLDLATGDVVPE